MRRKGEREERTGRPPARPPERGLRGAQAPGKRKKLRTKQCRNKCTPKKLKKNNVEKWVHIFLYTFIFEEVQQYTPYTAPIKTLYHTPHVAYTGGPMFALCYSYHQGTVNNKGCV